jgi:hypothetical protein
MIAAAMPVIPRLPAATGLFRSRLRRRAAPEDLPERGRHRVDVPHTSSDATGGPGCLLAARVVLNEKFRAAWRQGADPRVLEQDRAFQRRI